MKIEEIKRKYPNEWLLIKVVKTDERNVPVEGELIVHSKSRDEVYAKEKETRGHTYTCYSGQIPERGYAVAFYDKAEFRP